MTVGRINAGDVASIRSRLSELDGETAEATAAPVTDREQEMSRTADLVDVHASAQMVREPVLDADTSRSDESPSYQLPSFRLRPGVEPPRFPDAPSEAPTTVTPPPTKMDDAAMIAAGFLKLEDGTWYVESSARGKIRPPQVPNASDGEELVMKPFEPKEDFDPAAAGLKPLPDGGWGGAFSTADLRPPKTPKPPSAAPTVEAGSRADDQAV